MGRSASEGKNTINHMYSMSAFFPRKPSEKTLRHITFTIKVRNLGKLFTEVQEALEDQLNTKFSLFRMKDQSIAFFFVLSQSKKFKNLEIVGAYPNLLGRRNFKLFETIQIIHVMKIDISKHVENVLSIISNRTDKNRIITMFRHVIFSRCCILLERDKST